MSLFRVLNEAVTDMIVAIREDDGRMSKYNLLVNGEVWCQELFYTNVFQNKALFVKHFLRKKVCYVLYGPKVLWSRHEKPAQIIQRAWRKHRLHTTRDKNDFVLKGLAEYFGHPRFQDFSIE